MENLIAVSNKLIEVNNKLTEVTEQRDTLERELTKAYDKIEKLVETGLTQMDKERSLKRELAEARNELTEWHDAAESVKAEYPDEVHCTCVPILRKQIKTLTEQRDEALSDLEFRRDLFKLQEQQLNDVRTERDDLLRYNEAFRKETLICADCDAIRKEEYDRAIEQRDRLAANNNRVIELLKDGLQTDGSHHKQWYLNEVLKLINADIAKDVEMHWTHDKGIAP
jgi:hypothetical protein